MGVSADGRPFGDPGRIAAQIIAGVGFLGAGAILHGGGAVIGLTTAATIWAVAAIGMAIGAGSYVDALGATALIMIVLVGLRPVEAALLRKRRRLHATIRVNAGVPYETVETVIRELGIHVFEHRTYEHDTDRTFELNLVGASKQFDLLCDQLRRRPDVVSITTD
jgi:putative Mg2+ transporter-C (MgtC) family protein